MEKEINRFDAIADDGTVYTIVEIQEYVETNSIDKPSQWIEGLKRLELLDGTSVRAMGNNTFKLFFTDEIVRKVG